MRSCQFSVVFFALVIFDNIANLHSTNSDCVFQHFSPDLNLISVLIFIDLKNGNLSLGGKKDDGDGGLVACQTNADVRGVGIKQQLSLFVHFEKEVAGFDKKSLLVVFGDLNILFVVGNYFANFIVSVIT